MIHKDKKGEVICMHCIVNVDDPTNVSDCHKNAFTGVVIRIDDVFIVVQDQDGDCFSVLSDNVEVINEEDFEDTYRKCPDCGIGVLKCAMVDDNVGCGIHEETYCTYCDS